MPHVKNVDFDRASGPFAASVSVCAVAGRIVMVPSGPLTWLGRCGWDGRSLDCARLTRDCGHAGTNRRIRHFGNDSWQ